MIQVPPKPPSKPKAPVSPVDYAAQSKVYPRYEPLPSISDPGSSPDKVVNLSRVSFNGGFHVATTSADGLRGSGDHEGGMINGQEDQSHTEKGMIDGQEAESQSKDADPEVETGLKYRPIMSNQQAKTYFHRQV